MTTLSVIDDKTVIANSGHRQSDFYRHTRYPVRMDKHERLRIARKEAGFETAAEAARAHGWSIPAYRHHENGTAGYKDDRAAAYGSAYSVSPEWLLFGTGDGPEVDRPKVQALNRLRPVSRSIPVVGEVAAGVWREATAMDFEHAEEFIPVDVMGYERAQLYALRVIGPSMNLIYPEGRYVIMAPAHEAGIRIGDIVVVQRNQAGLTETTLKELVVEGGKAFLYPRSTDERYQAPISLHPKDRDQNSPMIMGVVVGDYAKRPRPDNPFFVPEAE